MKANLFNFRSVLVILFFLGTGNSWARLNAPEGDTPVSQRSLAFENLNGCLEGTSQIERAHSCFGRYEGLFSNFGIEFANADLLECKQQATTYQAYMDCVRQLSFLNENSETTPTLANKDLLECKQQAVTRQAYLDCISQLSHRDSPAPETIRTVELEPSTNSI